MSQQDDDALDTPLAHALKFLKNYWGILTSAFLLLGAVQVLIYYSSIGYLPPGLTLSDLTIIFALVATVSFAQVLSFAFLLLIPALIYRSMMWKPAAGLFRRRIPVEEFDDLRRIWIVVTVGVVSIVIISYAMSLPRWLVLAVSCAVIILSVSLILIWEWSLRNGRLKREQNSQQDQEGAERIPAMTLAMCIGFVSNLFILLWLIELIDGGAVSEWEKMALFLLIIVFLQVITLFLWVYLPNWEWRMAVSSLIIVSLTVILNQVEFFPESVMRAFKVGGYETVYTLSSESEGYKLMKSFGLDKNCKGPVITKTKEDAEKLYECTVLVLSSLGANVYFESISSDQSEGEGGNIKLELPKEALGPRAFREVAPTSNN